MSLKGKIRLIVFLAVAGIVAMAGMWLKSERNNLVNERMQSTKNLLEVPFSVVQDCYRLQASGQLSREDAQKRALTIIAAMRYDHDNYYWITDTHPTMVMHPIKPEMNGRDLSRTADPDGKRLFVEMAETAREAAGGFVFYRWAKPGQVEPVEKLSYVRAFSPWGWVLGTGVYTEDIDAAWRGYAKLAGGVGLLFLVVLLVVSQAVSRSIFSRLNSLLTHMRDIAEGEGDLTRRLDASAHDEIGALCRSFNTFMEKLHRTISQVTGNTHRLASASEEISVTSRQQASGAEEQREQTTQIAVSLQEMSTTVRSVAESSQSASQASRYAAEMAQRGGTVVKETLQRMRTVAASVNDSANKVEELGRRSEQIGQISDTINDIADQTNLLALNAAIEAARAGEAGRGFAVVADEVRKLAERSGQATRQIQQTIHDIQQGTAAAVHAMEDANQQVERGVESTSEAGRSLDEIIQSAQQAGQRVDEIATATTEQAATTEQIQQNVAHITSIITQHADMAQQASKAHEELSSLALELQHLVGQFKVASHHPVDHAPATFFPEMNAAWSEPTSPHA